MVTLVAALTCAFILPMYASAPLVSFFEMSPPISFMISSATADTAPPLTPGGSLGTFKEEWK